MAAPSTIQEQQEIYQEQLGRGMSAVYAQAFASKFDQGEVFARHFAILRERRYQSKLAAAAKAAGVMPATAMKDTAAAAVTAPSASKETAKGAATAVRTQTFSSQPSPADTRKRTPADFVIMKSIGTGSYSTVHLAKERATETTFAVKILEKAHIMKEKKDKYVMIEKEVFNLMFFSPFITKLYYTFQDAKKLYFVMELSPNGELLKWIKKLGSFDEECTAFYAAEMVMALEHMHTKNVIHRDLKPENILLSEDMHIKICDFGTAKVLGDDEGEARAGSFVGTAQYVSPELLNDKMACKESDIWAVGCIIYQLLSGDFPFRGGNEYQTFKKISALDYEIPAGFPATGKNLVESLLLLEPSERLGSEKLGGIAGLKKHQFFSGLPCAWSDLHNHKPPELDDYLPAMADDEADLHGRDNADQDIDDLIAQAMSNSGPGGIKSQGSVVIRKRQKEEKDALLKAQEDKSPWHGFCNPNELILKTGLVDKRKGLFAKRRMLVLTDAPRLFYIDPQSLAVMGEVPWTAELKAQYKTPKTFFIHTPDRTYYLDDVEKQAITWVDAIQKVLRM